MDVATDIAHYRWVFDILTGLHRQSTLHAFNSVSGPQSAAREAPKSFGTHIVNIGTDCAA
jgi:hypothetical protein